MAKQTILLGTLPSGQGGDTPRSAFTKTQSNFDELYARQALLASASNAALGTAAGNAMPVGAFGLGVQFSPGLPLLNDASGVEIYSTGFYRYASTTQGRPTFGTGFGALIELSAVYSGAANYGGQIAVDYATSEMGFRCLSGPAGFSAWRKIYHDGNTTRAADGTLKAI
ncbi:pyocin knob domain-containing protein [Pseudomonas sp. BF-RE-29]|uniref:pyocin knob domain-containing protein n=1 Tax=Pseudomonas sp. BF-RE-29 TaxID=2832378 RepID=UPI001CBD9C2C|nr:pyocin knob domain-containing protein [Pseudomonas sp. BF-RE-29]